MMYSEKIELQNILNVLEKRDVYKIISSDEMKNGVERYLKIREQISKDINKFNDEKFQTTYKGFYRMRRNKEFCKKYFEIGYKSINNENIDFDILFDKIKDINNRNESSFTSKLLHTINNKKPILDKNVLINLGLYKQYKKKDSNKKELYKILENIYQEILNSEFGNKWINNFDEVFSKEKNKISDTKKIDFILWKMK